MTTETTDNGHRPDAPDIITGVRGRVVLAPQPVFTRGPGVTYDEAADFGALAAMAGLERSEIAAIGHDLDAASHEVSQRVMPSVLRRVNAASARRLDRLAQAVRSMPAPAAPRGAVAVLMQGRDLSGYVSRQEVLLLIEQMKGSTVL